jgi:general stress protein 26
MDQEIVEKAVEIISTKGRDCVLALIDLDGYPTASAVTVLKNDGIKWLTFCTVLGNNKTKRIDKCNRASVCFMDSSLLDPVYNITLVGKIEVLTDPEIKKEMWTAGIGMEDQWTGPEDKSYCVLKFTTERYRLFIDWKTTEGKI